jgi:hypothetical protein
MFGIAPSGDGKAAARLQSRHNRVGRAQAQPVQ